MARRRKLRANAPAELPLIPAQAGIQPQRGVLGPRFRGDERQIRANSFF